MSSFAVKLWKSVKMIKFNCKHESFVLSWWIEQNQKFLFFIFKFWPKSHTWTLSEIFKFINFEVCFHSYVKLWKSVNIIKFECKYDLQVFSWWMEQNSEALVILKFWRKSYTWTFAEILKLANFWSLSLFTAKLWTSVKMIKLESKLDLQVLSWWLEQN